MVRGERNTHRSQERMPPEDRNKTGQKAQDAAKQQKRGEGVGYFCPYWNAKWSLQDGRAENGQNTVDQ